MISFREFIDRDRLEKHVRHHSTTKALSDAFPEKDLAKAKEIIYSNWRGKDKNQSFRNFIADDDGKWSDLWGKLRSSPEKSD